MAFFQGFGNFGFGGGPDFGGPANNVFAQSYKCLPVSLLDRKDHLENGGKIILPPSALDRMSRLSLKYPLLFELTNPKYQQRKTHCGVLEFVSEEGMMYLPFWMMQNLGLQPGELVSLRTIDLPLGNFVKFQPQSKAFLEISNPRAVLEKVLRGFSALTMGDTICINYNNRDYYLTVLEVKPLQLSKAISIVETDVIVDFAPPVDQMFEPQATTDGGKAEATAAKPIPKGIVFEGEDSDSDGESSSAGFKAFAGGGYTISGKKPSLGTSPASFGGRTSTPSPKPTAGASAKSPAKDDSDEEDTQQKKFVPFSGSGYSLKK
eukprot:TRINITY_DN6021_c0_g1_i1.p1 TRINITY_DN6021_c0_g1~~TRINITY_DN6021_c0_g1_i1.p1  ORF type:complete len:320 (-),score=97.59 TRINITY_DN6021_c0_g1_i1:269-1228(-)